MLLYCRPTEAFDAAILPLAVPGLPARAPPVFFLHLSSPAFLASAGIILASVLFYLQCFTEPYFPLGALLLISSITLLILRVCQQRVNIAGGATLTVYGELLPLHYRRSTPDPPPSTDILTSHPTLASLVVFLFAGANKLH